MTLKQAWERVALAGREIGSGAQVTIEYGNDPEFPGEGSPYFPYRQELIDLGLLPEYATGVAIGVLVGQLMAETQPATAGIKKINDDWLAGKLSR